MVNSVNVKNVSFSSLFEIGDIQSINARANVLAIQREEELFFTNEADFSQFPIFTKSLPIAGYPTNVCINTINQSPVIKVESVEIIGASTSAIIQIGCMNQMYGEARIKHIRHLLPRDETETRTEEIKENEEKT